MILWGTPTTISGDTDVLNVGNPSYAYDLLNATTVNGVSFTNITSNVGTFGTDVTVTGFNGGYFNGFGTGSAPYSTLSTAYKSMLGGGLYTSGATAVTVTLNNLTAGHTYATQIWLDESRAIGGRTQNVSGGGGNTVTLDSNSTDALGGVGQFTTGVFTANAANQALTMQANISTQLNALQVRDVTNIGYWVGTGGATWDASTTANFATNVFNSALTTADFATAKGALRAVTFADAYWNSGAQTAVTQTAITVAAGGVSTGSVAFTNSAVNYVVSSSDATGLTGTTVLSKEGTGSLTFLGTHTYTGGTFVAGGSLKLGDGTTNGSIAGNIALSTGTNVTFNNPTALTHGGVISGTGSLTKLGNGTLTLSANQTYNGVTTVSGGTLALLGTYAAPTAPFALGSGGALELNVATGTRDYATATFNGAGTLRKTGAGTAQWGSAAATFAFAAGGLIDVQGGTLVGGSNANENWTGNLGSLNVASGAVFNGVEANVRVDTITGTGTIQTGYPGGGYSTFTIGVNNGTGTFSGTLANSNSAGSITKIGSGTQIFAGTSTYSGTTSINAGTWQAGSANAFSPNSTFSLANVANATLNLAGFNSTIGALTGGGGVGGNVTLGSGILTVGGTNASTSYDGVISGAGGGLTKIGSGTLTLTRAETYTGPTSVNAGTLLVNASLDAASAVGVTGGTLGGIGVINGTATINAAGQVSPATSTTTGTLTFAGLTLGSGSLVDLEFGASSDAINVTTAGGLVINGGGINLFAAGGVAPLAAPGTYTLFTYNTTFGGSLANLTVPTPVVNTAYSVSDTGSAIQITLTAVTPSVWNIATSDSWNTSGSWSSGVPTGIGAVATFGTVPTSPVTVTVDGPKTVGSITFDNTNSYTVTGGAGDTITFDSGIAGSLITVAAGNHTIAAPLVLNGAFNVAPAVGTVLTLSGDISGARPLTQNAAGTTILTGTNSYSTTTVVAGTLQIGAGGTTGTLGSGAVSVAAGAKVVIDRSDAVTVGNAFTAPGTVTLAGSGSTTLSGNSTIGTLTVSAGSHALTGTSTVGTLNLTGAALALSGTNTVTTTNLQSGINTVTGSGETLTTVNVSGGTATFLGTNAITNLNVSGGTLKYVTGTTGATVPNLSGSGVLDLNGASVTFNDAVSATIGTTITDSGASAGVSTLSLLQTTNTNRTTAAAILNGPARTIAVELTNANGAQVFSNPGSTFSGGLTLLNSVGGTRIQINSSVATTGAPGAIVSGPFGTGPITIGLAPTDKAGIYFTTAATVLNDIVVNTSLGTDTPGLRVDGAGITLSGTITANQADAVFSVRNGGSGSVTLNGRLTGPFGLTLDNTFNNVAVTLANATASPNDYQGATTIAGTKGTLILGASDQIPNGPAAGTFVNNGTLNLAGFSETLNGVSGSGAIDGGSGTPVLAIGDTDATSTFSGVIRNSSGQLAVTKIGTGTLTLNGASTFTGGLLVLSGNIIAGSDSALGGAANLVTVANGASIDINGRALQGLTQNIVIAGTGTNPALGVLGNSNAAVNLNAIRGITLTADASIGGDGGRWDIGRVDFNTDPNSSVNHIDGGGFVLTKVGSGILGILSGATNLAGFVVNGGTVKPHENAAFGSGPVTLNGAIIEPWGGLNLANTFTLNSGTLQTDGFNDNYNGAVTVNGPVTINARPGGNITFNGNVTGSGSLTKIGGFSFFLSGDNSAYTGTVFVNQSNVMLNSATAGSAAATFSINGGSLFNTAAGPTTHELGALSGASGTLANNLTTPALVTYRVGALNADTQFSGGILDNVGGTSTGTTAITKVGTGSLTLNGTLSYTGVTTIEDGTLNVESPLGAGANIVNANGGETVFTVNQTLAELNIGDGALVTLGGPAAAPAPLFQGAAAVPEPGSISLLLLGALGMLGRRRRSA